MRIRVSSRRTGKYQQAVFFDAESCSQISIKELKTYPFESLSFTSSPLIDDEFYQSAISKINGVNRDSKALKEWKAISGLKHKELGEILGISSIHVGRVITGVRRLGSEARSKLLANIN